MALTDDLISYWKLNEASGNRADSHGSNTLTDNNTVDSTTGKIGNAALFDFNNSETLSVAHNGSMDLGVSEHMTFAFWIYKTSINGGAINAIKKSDSGFEWDIVLYADGHLIFEVSDDGAGTDNTLQFSVVPNNSWTFVVLRYDGSFLRMSINDSTTSSTSYSNGINAANSPLILGTGFSGRLDEIGYWKRAITDAEITELYNSGNGWTYPTSTSNRRRRLLLTRAA